MIDFPRILSVPTPPATAQPAQGPVPQEFSVPLAGCPGWVARYRLVRGALGARLEWLGTNRSHA